MKKPEVGDEVKLIMSAGGVEFETGKVIEVHDSVTDWWDGFGEDKMGLLEALYNYGEEMAATAEWYAVVENPVWPGETMAVASFECEPSDSPQK